jgi:type I restriction enzyme M protein
MRQIMTSEDWQARGYNLDFKNPHTVQDDHGDPEELLAHFDDAESRPLRCETS